MGALTSEIGTREMKPFDQLESIIEKSEFINMDLLF